MTAAPLWRPHARREELIHFVRDFITEIRSVPGIIEVSLIGSLSTSKADPKDADLLVRIEDGLDLTTLARHSRRLQGRAQSIGHGADIFLLSRDGEYLGRICQWKECAPGVRMRCDALHCGRRHYLHDDLQTVRLNRSATDIPAVSLLPTVKIRTTIPPDVMEILVRPLSGDPIDHEPGQ